MSPAARISLIYFVAGALWIVASDSVLQILTQGNESTYTLIQTVKGWLYVAASAAVLYYLLRREFDARRRSEQKVAEREAQFRHLFADNPLPMCVFDRNTLDFIDVNDAACEQYGYTHAEFLRMKITEIRPPEDVPLLLEFLKQSGPPPRTSTGKWRHLKKNGKIIDVEITSHVLEFAGKPAVLAVMVDITERKRHEAERLENERLRLMLAQEAEVYTMRSQFISTISHEFRRPLTTITASVELLEHYRSRMTDESAQKHFQRIHEQIAEMKDLLDDFLTLMRDEAGHKDFKPEPVDLIELCKKLTDELKISAPERHAIHFTSDCDRIVVDGDEKLLRHAIGNLLSNAVKYSPEGGEVRLELKHDEDIVISVTDQGMGIPAEDREHIFDPFFRAGNVGELSGTGLGLSIARRAVEAHGGFLVVAHSDSSGTEFVITLPVAERAILTGC